MDLINDKLSKIYLKYLAAAFGSAFMGSVFGLVDIVMVGQYHGPEGSAAMGVIAPVWNIVYSFGLLAGIGGSVLFSVAKGSDGHGERPENAYFTGSVIFGGIIALLLWVGLWLFEVPLLRLFGANDALLPLCLRYLIPVKFTVPFYPFSTLLSSFLRNDGNPALATKSVLFGGIFNVFGDYFFVFTLDMGILGAGLATAMGVCMSVFMMLTHFRSPINTMHFVEVARLPEMFGKIAANGFSSFIIDIAMGVLTMLFNRQIMRYLGSDALAVYAVIVNISTFVQCCAYGVGQAAQPIISQNYGAGRSDRVSRLLRYSLISCAVIGAAWTAAVVALPNGFIKLFMSPTAAVLAIAPEIMRIYAVSFLLLPYNVFSTYYFQAMLRPGTSIIISVSRGIVISGALIMILPLILGSNSVWFAMPISEAATAVYVTASIAQVQKAFQKPEC